MNGWDYVESRDGGCTCSGLTTIGILCCTLIVEVYYFYRNKYVYCLIDKLFFFFSEVAARELPANLSSRSLGVIYSKIVVSCEFFLCAIDTSFLL